MERLNEILKDIDEGFDITMNNNDGMCTITHKAKVFDRIHINSIDSDYIFKIRETTWLNKNNKVFDYVDKANELAEKRKEKKMEDMAYNLASDIRKPMMKELYG